MRGAESVHWKEERALPQLLRNPSLDLPPADPRAVAGGESSPVSLKSGRGFPQLVVRPIPLREDDAPPRRPKTAGPLLPSLSALDAARPPSARRLLASPRPQTAQAQAPRPRQLQQLQPRSPQAQQAVGRHQLHRHHSPPSRRGRRPRLDGAGRFEPPTQQGEGAGLEATTSFRWSVVSTTGSGGAGAKAPPPPPPPLALSLDEHAVNVHAARAEWAEKGRADAHVTVALAEAEKAARGHARRARLEGARAAAEAAIANSPVLRKRGGKGALPAALPEGSDSPGSSPGSAMARIVLEVARLARSHRVSQNTQERLEAELAAAEVPFDLEAIMPATQEKELAPGSVTVQRRPLVILLLVASPAESSASAVRLLGPLLRVATPTGGARGLPLSLKGRCASRDDERRRSRERP